MNEANSLVGTTSGDRVGNSFPGAVGLANGNYVVMSADWSGPALEAGAATWGNGETLGPRLVGTVTAGNSLVGSTALDRVGQTRW